MQEPRLHTFGPAALVAVGLLLMAFKIIEDSEPGLIPLLLVVGGGAWYAVARLRRGRRDRDRAPGNDSRG